jgi:hypothetical protein
MLGQKGSKLTEINWGGDQPGMACLLRLLLGLYAAFLLFSKNLSGMEVLMITNQNKVGQRVSLWPTLTRKVGKH